MVSSTFLNNEEGATLVELIVALALSSLLIVAFVSGSLFIQKYVNRWEQQDKIAEELSFVKYELSRFIERSQEIEIDSNSIVFISSLKERTRFYWKNSTLFRDGNRIIRSKMALDSIAISRIPLQIPSTDTILGLHDQERLMGLFDLLIIISDERGNKDSIKALVRNEYEFIKYSQR